MRKEYAICQERWTASDACPALKEQVRSLRAGGGVPVDNVVCFGIGSFQDFIQDRRRASLTQLAALISMAEELSQCSVRAAPREAAR